MMLAIPGKESISLIMIMAIGGMIAFVAPFDVVFDAATGGSAILRVCFFVALAWSGGWAGSKVGLTIQFHDLRHPVWAGLLAAICMAIAVALIDVVFRSTAPPSYIAFMHQDLKARLVYFMLRAFNENVFYRLFLFSMIALCLGNILRDADGRPLPMVFWISMVSAQVINISLNLVFESPVTATTVIYDGLRYITPGMCWAWLYWRHGFTTAEIASVTCHIFLQPAIGRLL
jgi:hypothetical protein